MNAVTATEPTISLTALEYLALDFAARMLEERAERLDDNDLTALGGICRKQADVLQRLHDRWHRASVIANEGAAHDATACAWCHNGGGS